MTDHLLVEVAAGVARLTLHAPERLNAVDEEMLEAVADAVEALDARDDVRVIALTGAGRGFCSGANLAGTDLAAEAPIPTGTLLAAGAAVRAIAGARTPVVALVNGVAAGVGVSLALSASYVLATESASFVLAFGRIGLMPDGGATAIVAASVGRARALRMALTGEKVGAAQAADWGLIAESCPDGAFVDRSAELVSGLAAAAPLAAAETIRAVNAASMDLDAAVRREEQGQTALLVSADFREGIAAFTDRRSPMFGGS
jgi:enoyl-CoA hydratase/carnithine racemase